MNRLEHTVEIDMTDEEMFTVFKDIIEKNAKINFAGDMVINAATLAQLIVEIARDEKHAAWDEGWCAHDSQIRRFR